MDEKGQITNDKLFYFITNAKFWNDAVDMLNTIY